MYLIDTNVLIRALAGQDPDAAFLKKAIERGAVALSVITLAEFLTKASPKEQRAIERLLEAFPLLNIDEQTARVAADYRKRFLRKSRGKLLDYLMAAQAKLQNFILITNNREDFPMKDIKIIAP